MTRDTQRDLYRSAQERTRPACDLDELNEQVIARMHAHHRGHVSARVSSGKTHPTPLSRRRFVALGAGVAAVAGVGILGVGIPLLGGKTSDSGGDTTSGMDASMRSEAPLFGLAVANAAEVASGRRATFELAATDAGLIPMVTNGARTTQLKLNLAVSGEGISELTYAIEACPSYESPFPTPSGWVESTESDTQSVNFQEASIPFGEFAYAGPFYSYFTSIGTAESPDGQTYTTTSPLTASFTVRADDVVWVDDSTRDVRSSSAAEGVSDASTGTGTYQLMIVKTPTAFWEGDELLSLAHDYQNLASRIGFAKAKRDFPEIYASVEIEDLDDTQLANLQAQLDELSAQITSLTDALFADLDATRDWMRACYVANLRCVADTLRASLLSVHATFEDGSDSTRSYRIDPIDGFDETVGARFDGLWELADPTFTRYEDREEVRQEALRFFWEAAVEHGSELDPLRFWLVGSGQGSGTVSASNLPYLGTVEGMPVSTDDPRLTAALFTITDVTADR